MLRRSARLAVAATPADAPIPTATPLRESERLRAQYAIPAARRDELSARLAAVRGRRATLAATQARDLIEGADAAALAAVDAAIAAADRELEALGNAIATLTATIDALSPAIAAAERDEEREVATQTSATTLDAVRQIQARRDALVLRFAVDFADVLQAVRAARSEATEADERLQRAVQPNARDAQTGALARVDGVCREPLFAQAMPVNVAVVMQELERLLQSNQNLRTFAPATDAGTASRAA